MVSANLIAAVGKRGQLGLGGKLPWYDPEDLAWFKAQTAGGFVVMGGRTYESVASRIHGKNGRVCVAWGRDLDPAGFLKMLSDWEPQRTIWIAGGALTYQAFMPFVRRSFITHVDYDGEADVFLNLGLMTGHQ